MTENQQQNMPHNEMADNIIAVFFGVMVSITGTILSPLDTMLNTLLADVVSVSPVWLTIGKTFSLGILGGAAGVLGKEAVYWIGGKIKSWSKRKNKKP